jgi:hypothetical protein
MSDIRLPNPKPAQPLPFAIGSRVRLRILPHGPPGVVLGTNRRKVRVRWASYVGSHLPGQLVLAQEPDETGGSDAAVPNAKPEPDEPAVVPEAAPVKKEMPYDRLLRRLRESQQK